MTSDGRTQPPLPGTEGDLPSTATDTFQGDIALELGPASRIYLVARVAERTEVIELHDDGEVTIGRAPDSTLAVDEARVSRNHARIWRRGNAFGIDDLGSRNGTRINGKAFRAGTRALVGGDLVQVGPVDLVVAAAAPRDIAQELEDSVPATLPVPRSPVARPFEPGTVVADQAMVQVYRVARRLAETPTTVLILGETGVGKEVIAEHIHQWSPRRARPFVKLNCASLPESLLESELFGYERGAFTGADKRKVGYVEAADGGTLLLDEIGELSAATQAKLLRVLENRRVPRVGSTQELPIDVRFVCATHRDLAVDVAAGRFRQDLYYRVAGFTLKVPSLRERPTEITLLAELFAREFAERSGAPPPRFDPEAAAAILRHPWPGNVRELRNAIEHAVIVCEGGTITAADLPDPAAPLSVPPSSMPASAGPVRSELADLERRRIEEALAKCDGNQTHAAKLLGMSRRNLVYKMGKYGLKR